MKHLLLYLITLTVPLLLTAQDEYSFLENNLQWVEEHFYSDGENTDPTQYLQFNVAEDTLIQDVTYRKWMLEEFYQGALREESGKLILLRDGVETTLLDFTLTVGDTIFLSDCDRNTPLDCQTLSLVSIDSVEVLDGSLRKRLTFELYLPNTFNSSLYYTVSWIDGSGSTYGLELSNCGVIGGGRSISPVCEQRLICVQDDHNLLFNNTQDQVWECSERAIVSSTHDGQLPEGSVMVSPNPTQDLINIISTDQVQLTRLRLQDVAGRVLLDQVVSPLLPAHQLSLSGFPQGLYVLTAFIQEGKWAAVRLVKQ